MILLWNIFLTKYFVLSYSIDVVSIFLPFLQWALACQGLWPQWNTPPINDINPKSIMFAWVRNFWISLYMYYFCGRHHSGRFTGFCWIAVDYGEQALSTHRGTAHYWIHRIIPLYITGFNETRAFVFLHKSQNYAYSTKKYGWRHIIDI